MLQAVTLILLFITMSDDSKPLFSTLTAVSSAVLMIGAWSLNTGVEYVWDAAIRAYVTAPVIIQTSYLAYFNMLIFALAILYFFNDIMDVARAKSKGMGDVNASQATNNGGNR